MGDKSQGHYARLALVDADGNEMEKHFARDFTTLSNEMKRPDDEAWVAAKWGEKFGIKQGQIVYAQPGEKRSYKIFADGTLLRAFHTKGGRDSVLKEVCTRTIGDGYGGTNRKVYQPLVFAQPEIQEKDERPLAQQLAGSGVDKLGRITLEVWDVVKRRAPRLVTGTIADAQGMGGTRMNEKALIKKGAFASTTQLGEERVAVEGKSLSQHKTGHNKLETLEIRYGHVSQLLMLGAPVERFRVPQNPNDIETIELDDDEEEDKNKNKKRGAAAAGGVKEEKKGVKQENKRVKTEPGTASAAAASSSSSSSAAPAPAGVQGDGGTWDLT